VLCDPLALQRALGVYDACTTYPDGGLAAQFWPHLPEKYDGTVNPVEFLQIYSTSNLVAGGDEAVMTNYFPVALTGTTR
jgi:hypothetical protein